MSAPRKAYLLIERGVGRVIIHLRDLLFHCLFLFDSHLLKVLGEHISVCLCELLLPLLLLVLLLEEIVQICHLASQTVFTQRVQQQGGQPLCKETWSFSRATECDQSETSLLMPPGLPQQLAPPTLPLRLHVTVQRDVRARCAVDQFLPREDCERGKVRSSGAQHAADEMTAMSENPSQKFKKVLTKILQYCSRMASS